MTDDRIRECEALCDKATPGPWVQWRGHATVYAGTPTENTPVSLRGNIRQVCDCDTDGDETARQRRDAAFIAAARTGWPETLTALREAKAREDGLRGLMLNALTAFEMLGHGETNIAVAIRVATRAALEPEVKP